MEHWGWITVAAAAALSASFSFAFLCFVVTVVDFFAELPDFLPFPSGSTKETGLQST